MTSRWKKIWADLWGNKSRTVLTIITIAVGTFAVGFTNNMGLYMSESMDSDFLLANPSEAEIYASPMDDDSVKIAREVPGVNAVEGRSTSDAQIIHLDGKKIAIQFTAVDNPYELTVNTLKPVQNESIIPPLGDKEVLIDSSAASLAINPAI